MERRKIISVIGDSTTQPNDKKYQLAHELGKVLIDNDYRIMNGGMSGIMQANAEGAKTSDKYREGDVIGIIPTFNPGDGNAHSDIVIATGMDTYRNVIVANSDAVIAIGGGAGTLSEIAAAWIMKRLIIGYTVDGWSGKLAGQKLDGKYRTDYKNDQVFPTENASEVISLLEELLPHYNLRHKRLNER